MRKNFAMLLVAALLGATAGAETYYLDPTVDYSVSPYPNALTNGYYWTTERDGSGTRSSETIAPLSKTDHYVIANGTATNKAAWVRHGGTVTSTGGYIHIGDETTEPWTAGALVLDSTGSGKTFTQSYTNYLNRGEIAFLGAYSRTTKLTTNFVRATKEDPFHLAFGASKCAVTWSGLTLGDENACLVIGGKSDLCPATSSYTGNSVYMSGKNYNYYGTVIVTNENRSIPSFSTRPVGFKLRYNLPATLVLCDYTSFTFYNTNTLISVRDLELGDQVLFNVPMSNTGNSKLTVTGSFKMAPGAKVQVLANMSEAHTTDRTVTVLTVPGVNTLSPDNFEIAGLEAERGFTLSIKNDTSKKTCSLQVNVKSMKELDEGYVVAKKSDTTGSGNAVTYQSIVTNTAAWTDGAVVGPGKDYFVHGFGATTFALRTPQKAWEDGTGNTGDDFTFPGRSLTIGENGQLLAVGTKTTFDDVRLLDGSIVGNPNTAATPVHTICGTMTVEPGTTSVRVYSNKVQRLEVDMKGTGHVKFDGWSVKGKSTIFLDGDNSEFKGTMELTNAYSSAGTSSMQTLYVDRDEELGGALDSYDPKAFLLTRYSYLIVSNSVTMARNRGLTMYGYARLYVRKGTFSLDGLTLAGTQYLAGNIRVRNLTSSGKLTLNIPENTVLTLVREKPVANDRGLDLSGNKTLTITSGKKLAFASEIVQPVSAPRVITNAVVTAASGSSFISSVRSSFGTAATRTSPIAGYDVTSVVETKNADGSVTFKEVLTRNYTPGTMVLVGVE